MNFLFSIVNRLWRKPIIALASIGISTAFLLPLPTHAQFGGWLTGLFGIGSVLGGAIGWVAFVIAYLVTSVVGFFLSLMVIGIGIMLELNTNIINTTAVQKGFEVSLQVANLGFVLGIIIIAIATIIRYESYGMKKLLVKLIVAALLVNFSLVITGGILNFSDQFSKVFLTALPGGGGGTRGFHEFAKAFGGAFNPQRAILNPTLSQADYTTEMEDLQKVGGAAAAGQSLGAIFAPFISLIFAAVILIVICITIAVFFWMLVVRYIYIGMLLIVMPLVWLLWVFPNTSKWWSSWWDKFWKWTFFAPVSLFFLWLVIITSEKMSQEGGTNPYAALKGLGLTSADDTSFLTGLSNFVLGGASNTIGTFLQAAVLVGLSIGGIIVAEKFGIAGGHATKWAVKAVGNWGIRRSKQLGGKVLQTKGWVPNIANKMMSGGYGQNSSNRFMRGLGKAAKLSGVQFAGQKIGEAIQAGEVRITGKLAKEEAEIVKKETAGMTNQQKANLIPGANMARRIALIEQATKEGWLDKVDAKYIAPDQKAAFKRFGKEEAYENAQKATDWAGLSKPYLEAMTEAEKIAGEEAEMWAERKGLSRDTEVSEAGKKAYEEAKMHGDNDKEAEEARDKAIAVARYKKGQVAYEEAIAHGDSPEKAENARESALQKANEPSEFEKYVKQATQAAREKAEVAEIDPETGKPTGRTVNALEKQKEIQKKVEELKKGDKVQYKEIFGDKPAFGLSKESIKIMAEVLAEKMAHTNQQLVPQIIGKLNAKQLQSFEKLMKTTYNKGINASAGDLKKKLQKGLDNLNKSLASHMTSQEHEAHVHEGEDHGEHAHKEEHAPKVESPFGSSSGGGGDHPNH
ncbi:MAG: hypothetical protein FJY98_00955 [Candidatus Liptonbacteria bacterium]|nr:hypothetical protein [Candidatus Liptonbacteria bacterium]